MYYILTDDNQIKQCPENLWMGFFGTSKGRKTIGDEKVGDYHIITRFFGINRGMRNKEPIVFDTIILDENLNPIYEDNYTNFDEAVMGHHYAVQWTKEINGYKKLSASY